MKKRIILILFMFLTTLVLAGCDLFGPKITTLMSTVSETPTTVTTSTPTSAPTTTTTTSPASSVTTATTVQGSVTISFEENGGNAVPNITQVSGTAVTAPSTPTRTGYTFVGWYSNAALTTAYTFSTMPSSNLTLYAKWQVSTFTVSFYDDDGELIETQTIAYGQGAIAPTAPYKVGVVFTGWDKAFSNITGNISVNAIYEEHYEPLVQMIFMMFDEEMSDEDIDETIHMMMYITGLDTEEDVFLMMTDVMTLVGDLSHVTSLSDFQTWFVQLSIEGYDKETIVQMLVSAVLVFIDSEANNYNPQEFLDEIAAIESDLADANIALLAQKTAMADYCAALPPDAKQACEAYLVAFYQNITLEEAFDNALWPTANQLWGEEFDWSLYYDMEWAIYMYYQALYNWEDEEETLFYLEEFNSLYDELTSEELLMYDPIITLYRNWQVYEHTVLREASESLYFFHDSINDQSVGEFLNYQISQHFSYAYYEVKNCESRLENTYQWMEENEASHEMTLLIRDYLWSVEGKAKVTTLANTLYDVVASVIVGIDEDTFNLLIGLALGQIDFETLPMTPTNISEYAHQVADLLTLLTSTLDESDAANIISLGHDILEIALPYTGMSVEEQELILSLVQLKGPEYFGILSDVYGEVINMLSSMTPEKVEAIMTFISSMKDLDMDNDQMVIVYNVATLIDVLLYDESISIELLIGHFVTVYYDIDTMFSADPLVTEAVKLAFIQFANEMISLSHEIALFDLENLSISDKIKMYELYKHGERLIMLFENGDIEDIQDPYDYLEARQMLYGMINSEGEMSQEQTDALIDVIIATFGLDSEIETMLTIMQIMELDEFVMMIESIEDVQDLYLLIGEMGFDNETLAEMVATFLDEYSNYIALYEYDPDLYQMYQDGYNDAYTQYLFYSQQYNDLLNDYAYEVSQMSSPLYDDIVQMWDIFLYNRQLEDDFWSFYSHYSQLEENYWIWDAGSYWYFDDILNRYYQTIGGNNLPPELRVNDLNMFYTELSHYSPQEQQMYLDVLYFADINYEYHWTVYMPAFMNIGETYFFPAYQTSTNMPITAWFISMIDNYNEYTFQMGEYQRQIDFYSEQLRYQDEKAMWLFIDEFFDDPDNHLLVKEVALILLEEIESLIMYEDTDTYNLVIGLMTGSIDPSTLDLSPAGILAFVNAGQDFLNHLFSSMDETDKSTVLQLLNKAVYFYLNTLGMSPEDTEAMYLTIQPKVSAYFYSIFDIKQLVVDFMDTLTVEKIDTVIAAINILDSLPEDYEEGEESLELNDDLVRAIYISTIIDTLLASDALDTDYLIELVIYGYFDISYGFNYTGGVVIDDLVLELQTLIDAIIAQTDIVENYRIHINEEFLTVLYDDPMTSEIIEGMTESDIYEIETLKDLIDQLGYFIENGPEGYLPTV